MNAFRTVAETGNRPYKRPYKLSIRVSTHLTLFILRSGPVAAEGAKEVDKRFLLIEIDRESRSRSTGIPI